MDEHAVRICQPLVIEWFEFLQARATMLDLARLALQASSALDNASAPLPETLARAASDLEYAYYDTESEAHVEEASRILGTVLIQLGAIA